MPDRSVSRLTVTAALCLGLAAWCSLGVLTFTESGPAATRVGVLPPWWTLAVLVGVAVAVLAALRLPPARVWPLGATVAVIVPWLPIPLPPSALAWTGPLCGFVWALAVAGSLAAAPWAVDAGSRWRAWFVPPRAPWLALAVAFGVYVAAAWHVAPVLPGGDEPHYLIITQSLLADGDLRIENNHRQRDYASYAKGVLKPDYLRRGIDREIYSIHLPGVSVLVAPAFALGGYQFVKVWLAGVSALASMVAWRVAFTVAGSVSGAWFAWAATALTVPFLFLAFTVYPDGPGGALVIVALACLVSVSRRRDRPGAWWLAAGVAPALLPWFHPRFSVVAMTLGLVLAGRVWHERRRVAALAAFVAVPVVSAAGWFGYYAAIYGTPNPSAPYGHYTQMAVSNVWRGLTGLLVDHQFGLVAAAPVYALVCVGLVALVRREGRLGWEWLVVVLPYSAVSAMYHMWWGGHSSPARFLGPVMLACALPLAAAWRETTNRATRTLQACLLAVSLVLTGLLAGVEQGRLAFNTRDGFALWAVWASRGADVARGLPSVFRIDATTAFESALIWVAVMVCAWLVFKLATTRAWMLPGAAALGFTVLLVASATMAMSGTERLEGARRMTPGYGQLALLAQAGREPGGVGLTYDPWLVGSVTQTAARIRLDGAGLAGRPTWAWLWLPRVPAGRYRVWFDNLVAGTSVDVGVIIGRGEQAIETWRLQNLPVGPTSHEMVLPGHVRSLALKGEAATRARLGSITLEAVEVTLASRVPDARVTSARRYGEVVVMAVGEDVYLEDAGLWVTGQVAADVIITGSTGRTEQPMLVRGGPTPVRVELATEGWREAFTLLPGSTRDVTIPLRPGAATVLRVKTDTGFRPSVVDPASTDRRFLGVWLEPR